MGGGASKKLREKILIPKGEKQQKQQTITEPIMLHKKQDILSSGPVVVWCNFGNYMKNVLKSCNYGKDNYTILTLIYFVKYKYSARNLKWQWTFDVYVDCFVKLV